MSFAHPWFLLGLLLVPIVVLHGIRPGPALGFSSTARAAGPRGMLWLRHLPVALRALAVTLLVVALARPQTRDDVSKRNSEGLDIVLTLDTSGSMRALDFVIDGERRTRMEIVKKVIKEFVAQRVDDRIGMVVFGTEAFTQAPLTLDHDVLDVFLERVETGMAGENTAIGDALGVSVNRLKDVKAKSKVVILLTDGESNAGKLQPLTAANAAKALGVKVYTVGVGTNGAVPVLLPSGQTVMSEVRIDEDVLKKIAEATGGAYFLASDTETLRRVYQTIDYLEKTKIETETFGRFSEHFAVLAWLALACLGIEAAFGMTRFRRIP